MSNPVSYYKGEILDPSEPVTEQLKAKGLTEAQIELIEKEVYTVDPCCETFGEMDGKRPVVDYGVPAIRGYEGAIYRLDKDGNAYHSWVVWSYCPFCGKPLAKEIHIGCRQTVMEDF